MYIQSWGKRASDKGTVGPKALKWDKLDTFQEAEGRPVWLEDAGRKAVRNDIGHL